VDEEIHPDNDLVEADTCRTALFYLCNFKLDSDGLVLLAFQRLVVFYTASFNFLRFYLLHTNCN